MSHAISGILGLAKRLAVVAALVGAVAGMGHAGKDLGPSGACDAFAKVSPDWSRCAGTAVSGLSDEDLFYAGYWLARLGRYDAAISYLSAAKAPDARTLTYLGFATRKSGDVAGAFPYYRKALALNPDYVVARAYLGEAYLAVGDAVSARNELGEIARRCGAACAAYDELARHISRAEAVRG